MSFNMKKPMQRFNPIPLSKYTEEFLDLYKEANVNEVEIDKNIDKLKVNIVESYDIWIKFSEEEFAKHLRESAIGIERIDEDEEDVCENLNPLDEVSANSVYYFERKTTTVHFYDVIKK
jgi:hypothetical protein